MAILPVGFAVEAGGYQIERSLRFNSADSAYLNRTPGSAGNKKTFTISLWIKRSKLGASTALLDGDSSDGNRGEIYFDSSDKLNIYDFYAASGGLQITSARVFRDVGSWYHIVFAFDTTQATDSNRLKIYVNGVQESLAGWSVGSGASRYPTQNADFSWNGATSHWIGRTNAGSAYFDGYMTEIHSVDGSQLAASDFGETDSDTGVWKPKAYSGSYGTNGFYLDFGDNSSTTALGYDAAGSNDWTPNNFSVTAGSNNDSLVDSPTRYGTDTGVGAEVRGNYCTLNPLQSAGTLSNGNLDWTGPTGNGTAIGTLGVTSGKWYFECNLGSTSNKGVIGLVRDPQQADINTDGYSGNISGRGYAIDFETSPPKLKFNGTATNYGTQPSATSDILMVALDLTNNSIFFGMNGTWFGSSNPATNTSPAYSSITAGTYFPFVADQWGSASSSWVVNFGQRPFAYTAPSGFKALCTQNLPEPTVADGGEYFNAVLWTGDSSASQAVTGVGFQPDLVWAKSRPANSGQDWVDSVRGATKNIQSSSSAAETTSNTVISFQSDGFTVGDGLGYDINKSGESVVGWCWKESATAGFDIVTYTGDGVAGRTVSHNLGVAPSMIIVKSRGTTDSWGVYHASLGNTKGLYLETTSAAVTSSAFWNNTSPTSTVFSVSNNSINNASSTNYVAYCFTEVPGYSSMGSYVGNGNIDGPFIHLGFRARYLLIKCSSAAGEDWTIQDTARNPYNPSTQLLVAQSSAAEGTAGTTNVVDTLSNGFKVRTTSGRANSNGATYIYAAFAENPFKYALAR